MYFCILVRHNTSSLSFFCSTDAVPPVQGNGGENGAGPSNQHMAYKKLQTGQLTILECTNNTHLAMHLFRSGSMKILSSKPVRVGYHKF